MNVSTLFTMGYVTEQPQVESLSEVDSSFDASGPPQRRGAAGRAYRLLALLVLIRPFGNLCLAWGLKHFSQVLSANPFVYVRAMFNPFVAGGIGLLALALLMRMALLSLADLSFVLPLTAVGYILTTLMGKFFLRERVTLDGWLGTLLIFVGILVVGSTSQKTTREVQAQE